MPPLSFDPNGDVISAIDLRLEEDALAWVAASEAKKPLRPQFRAEFVRTLRTLNPLPRRILELGSGPGRLAREIIDALTPDEYVLFDFSEPMMALAKRELELSSGATFVLGSFKTPDWTDALLGPFDAIVAMQAVHEIRHKRHVPQLYARARQLLHPGGLLIVCDHEPAESAESWIVELHSTRAEQQKALETAGFVDIECRLFEQQLYLVSARTN